MTLSTDYSNLDFTEDSLSATPLVSKEALAKAAVHAAEPRQVNKPAKSAYQPTPSELLATSIERVQAAQSESFGELGSFVKGSGDRFKLASSQGKDFAALAVAGSGYVKATLTDAGVYRIEGSVPQDFNAKEATAVSINAARNTAVRYEQGVAVWEGTDAKAASRAVGEMLNLLTTKATVDRALDAGIVNKAWFEVDKVRHVLAGAGLLIRGELPAFGRDKSDQPCQGTFRAEVLPLSNRQATQVRTGAVYLCSEKGVAAFIVPFSSTIALVHDPKGEFKRLEASRFCLLESDPYTGKFGAQPCTRERAHEATAWLVESTKRSHVGLNAATGSSGLEGVTPPEDISELRAWLKAQAQAPALPEDSFNVKEAIAAALTKNLEPALVSKALKRATADNRVADALGKSSVLPERAAFFVVPKSEMLATPARRKFEALGNTSGIAAFKRDLTGPELYKLPEGGQVAALGGGAKGMAKPSAGMSL